MCTFTLAFYWILCEECWVFNEAEKPNREIRYTPESLSLVLIWTCKQPSSLTFDTIEETTGNKGLHYVCNDVLLIKSQLCISTSTSSLFTCCLMRSFLYPKSTVCAQRYFKWYNLFSLF